VNECHSGQARILVILCKLFFFLSYHALFVPFDPDSDSDPDPDFASPTSKLALWLRGRHVRCAVTRVQS
jgi:hypothetical protein